MEEAMSVSKQVLLGVLQEAATGGNELIPGELIAAVLNQSEPIKALSEHDQGNLFFDEMRRQFNFIALLQVTEQHPSTEDLGRWVALMRWFIRELQEWRLSNDPKFHKLTILFVVSAYCDRNGDLWTTLPDGAEQNNDLLHTLERLIAGIRSDVVMRGLGREPIWEREAVKSSRRPIRRRIGSLLASYGLRLKIQSYLTYFKYSLFDVFTGLDSRYLLMR